VLAASALFRYFDTGLSGAKEHQAEGTPQRHCAG